METIRVRSISVRPCPGGWGVHVDGGAGGLAFRSGAQAETAARKLAARYAALGQVAEIRIFLKDGSLAARLTAAPWAPAPRAEPVAA